MTGTFGVTRIPFIVCVCIINRARSLCMHVLLLSVSPFTKVLQAGTVVYDVEFHI